MPTDIESPSQEPVGSTRHILSAIAWTAVMLGFVGAIVLGWIPVK